MINIGSAGGHTIEITAGDIVVCDKAIYHGGYIMTQEPTKNWETIAIYHVCHSKKVPVIAYRIIANNELQGTLYEDYVYEVNHTLQTVIAELLNSLN